MPILTTRRPERADVGLLLLIGTAAAATLPLGCAAPAWRNVLCALAAAAGGLVLLRRNPRPALAASSAQKALHTAIVLVLLLHAGLAFSGIFPDASAVAETFAFRTALVVFALAAATILRDPKARRVTAAAAAIIAVFQVTYGLLSPDPLAASSINSSWRLRGTFSSGNSLGSFLALVLPLLTGWLHGLLRGRGLSTRRILHVLQQGDIRRILPAAALAAALLISMTGLVLTGSRGALLAAIAGCALALAPQWRRKSRAIRISIPLGILAIFGAIMLTGGRFSFAEARWKDLKPFNEAAGRPEIWGSLTPLLIENPFGVGMGALRVVAHTVQPEVYGYNRLLEAHSDPFEILLEFGLLPGLLILSGLALLVLPPLLRSLAGESGVRAGMAGSVLAGILHGFVDFNLLWRPGVLLWFLLCLGGILRARTWHPATPLTRHGTFGLAVAVALTSAFLGFQHFRSEWSRQKAGGRRDVAMTWLREPVGYLDTMPLPSLSWMTADAAARMASAWITMRDRLDRQAHVRDTANLQEDIPVTGTFFSRQFRWSEHASNYATLAANADRVLIHAPGNAELRLQRDIAATRAWLASPTNQSAPHLPADPDATSRLFRIRATYASMWLDRCRRVPSDLPTARRWLMSLPPNHPTRRLIEAENADILRLPP